MGGQLKGVKEVLVHRVFLGLASATALCVCVVMMMLFFITDEKQRLPYLDVNILPDEPLADGRPVWPNLLERPVFWETRRPVAESVVEDDVKVDDTVLITQLEGVKLLGIISGDKARAALLEVEGKALKVKKSDKVMGWTVSKIRPREVQLVNGNEQSVLVVDKSIHANIRLTVE